MYLQCAPAKKDEPSIGIIQSKTWTYTQHRLEGSDASDCTIANLIKDAKAYFQTTGRHLFRYGELGEYYAACRFNIQLHKDPCKQGSDGHMGNHIVEIKTLCPRYETKNVSAKKAGNFSYLAIVRIDSDFNIRAKLISRKKLKKTNADHFVVNWDEHECEHLLYLRSNVQKLRDLSQPPKQQPPKQQPPKQQPPKQQPPKQQPPKQQPPKQQPPKQQPPKQQPPKQQPPKQQPPKQQPPKQQPL